MYLKESNAISADRGDHEGVHVYAEAHRLDGHHLQHHQVSLLFLMDAHPFWMYGYHLMDTTNLYLHVPQLQLVLGTLAFLGRGGRVLGNLS